MQNKGEASKKICVFTLEKDLCAVCTREEGRTEEESRAERWRELWKRSQEAAVMGLLCAVGHRQVSSWDRAANLYLASATLQVCGEIEWIIDVK